MAKDAGRYLLDKVFGSFVSVAVSAVLTGLIASGIAIAANVGLVMALGIGLSIFGVLCIGGTGFVLYHRRRTNSYVSYPEVKFATRVIKKHYTYAIGADNLMRFTRTLELEALSDNVDRYTDKFMWTGGESDIPRPGEGVVETRRLIKAGIWTYYDSMFDRVLRQGERITITTYWPPLANWAQSNPFVSTSAEEKTDLIEFTVRIPAYVRAGNRVIMEEMRSIESPYPFKTHPDLSFQDDEFHVSIKPEPYRHYRVRWSWRGADQVVTIAEAVAETENS
ncbi:hypothetical protein AB0230_08835 [Microbacterium sp. NPDC089190]|uniref:hypothetical protein n=1 Tax=Microbacterium sp. NPDC089190 TaxID=3155063 RepID=UPI00344E489B